MTLEDCYKEMGGNYADVISRLRTNERVIKFLGKMTEDKSFALLEEALARCDVEEAFRAAHTLKGVSGNLSLTKLYDSSSHLTEALRGRTEYGADIKPLFECVKNDYNQTVESIRKFIAKSSI